MSNEYKTAYEEMIKAEKAYQVALADYRSLKIGDDEYLAARSIHTKAIKIYDAAFAKEAA